MRRMVSELYCTACSEYPTAATGAAANITWSCGPVHQVGDAAMSKSRSFIASGWMPMEMMFLLVVFGTRTLICECRSMLMMMM